MYFSALISHRMYELNIGFIIFRDFTGILLLCYYIYYIYYTTENMSSVMDIELTIIQKEGTFNMIQIWQRFLKCAIFCFMMTVVNSHWNLPNNFSRSIGKNVATLNIAVSGKVGPDAMTDGAAVIDRWNVSLAELDLKVCSSSNG